MATPLTKPSDLTPSNVKKAQVLSTNELIEEEVTLLIDKTIVTCFTTHCPYKIEQGSFYDIEISLNLSDNYEVQKICPTKILAEQVDNSFSYILYGILNNDLFETFTPLNDEGIHYEHPDLNGHFIKVSIERIDVAFL
ncbi:hypothetical protein [Pseudomonas sp. SDO5271_S396]